MDDNNPIGVPEGDDTSVTPDPTVVPGADESTPGMPEAPAEGGMAPESE